MAETTIRIVQIHKKPNEIRHYKEDGGVLPQYLTSCCKSRGVQLPGWPGSIGLLPKVMRPPINPTIAKPNGRKLVALLAALAA